ncbi:MAG: hypothetical protein SVM79_03535 [Chloroflexota bacterium]|nr:hypothetical protein [Chloroflexota bacterium]
MSIVDTFLVWWLRSGRYRWSRLRRKMLEGQYLNTELPEINSLEDIETCLQQITWTGDGFWHLYDSISYPQRVWAKKKDDCDGFSILAAALLRLWNPATNPVLITAMVRPVRKSHTICAFKSEGELLFFDNATLRRGDFENYGDIVARFTRRADHLICWDVVDPNTLKTLEFHRA